MTIQLCLTKSVDVPRRSARLVSFHIVWRWLARTDPLVPTVLIVASSSSLDSPHPAWRCCQEAAIVGLPTRSAVPKGHSAGAKGYFRFQIVLESQLPVQGNKICILDDDPSVLRSLKELLGSDDLEAETFDDPEKFLDYVRVHAVGLAILDFWMPRQTRIQVQEQLRHLSPETRVIVITGREGSAIRRLVLDGGAFAFFSKPVDTESFLASVRVALTE